MAQEQWIPIEKWTGRVGTFIVKIRNRTPEEMPVPKDKQKLYGKVAGHLQNLGFSYEEAKDKADSAIMNEKPKKKRNSKKNTRKRGSKAGY